MLPRPWACPQRAPGSQRAQRSSQKAPGELPEMLLSRSQPSRCFPDASRGFPDASQVPSRSRNGPKNVENCPKGVQKNDPGVSGGQERSKLRCGSIGSTPGPQKLYKSMKNASFGGGGGFGGIPRCGPIARCRPYSAYSRCLGSPAVVILGGSLTCNLLGSLSIRRVLLV